MIYFYGFRKGLVGVEFDLDRHGQVVPVCATMDDGTDIDLDSDDGDELQCAMLQQDVDNALKLYGKGK